MRILLVSRPHPEGARDPFTSLLPTGLGYLNAVLSENGFASSLANLSAASWRQVEELLRRERPAILGISVFTHNRFESLRLAALAKKVDPACLTIFGGPHATHAFESILIKYREVDAVILGEGEETFLDLARAVERGDRSLAGIAGLAYRKGTKVHYAKRLPVADLDALPLPALHMDDAWGCDVRRQLEFIITSRGCPAACRFCSSPRFWGKSLRFRSPRVMVDEIRAIRDRYGLIYFSLRDDTFTVRKDRVIDFCRLLLEEKVHILWNCQSRVNAVDEEMLIWMRRAGCECVQYGVESGSEKILAYLGKQITPEQVRRAARATRRAGISLSIYLITGVPGETDDDLQATLTLVNDVLPHDGHVAPLAYYPGTALFDEAVREGRVSADLFERERGAALYVRSDPFVTRSMETLLRALTRVGRKARFGPADFAAQREFLGYCHGTNLGQGEWLEVKGDIGKAETLYREIVERQPENPWGWLALGGLHGSRGEVTRAGKAFERAMSLVPAHVPAYLALGDLRLEEGDQRGAKQLYETAKRLNPRDPDVGERLRMAVGKRGTKKGDT
ncbi:radical SAM protein [Geobacter hydrogenophilus]|uniref:B12-binding domain-containing radical SAM protein n=1 Tax=Geobacter hydrogenophilus TaxID=40983 RepID=A0A9W6FXU3_9BACT|nr:radical SAM protein [Geobacter hydrogenophilus]MBT0895696.1 radical SAM protein [Geobacter hydrogenophilus]GLI36835.1 B12-binding domain-containing radical SAM protein [Geobacter hydrogenophilus]